MVLRCTCDGWSHALTKAEKPRADLALLSLCLHRAVLQWANANRKDGRARCAVRARVMHQLRLSTPSCAVVGRVSRAVSDGGASVAATADLLRRL